MGKVHHLYFHLPFCSTRCGYCDFYSETGRLASAGAYVDAMLAELEDSSSLLGRIKTVYVGGGSPTLLGAGLLGRLLAGVRQRADMTPDAEITVEANPATVGTELAHGLQEAGVNRASLGVQSFSARLRRNLGRPGAAAAVEGAVTSLRAEGFENLGLDLIFGIPGQSVSDLREDLVAALAMQPVHVSCYELTVHEGTPFARRWAAELRDMAGRDAGRQLFECAADTLEAVGYRWYETSNFAVPGRECRHNLAYWDGADYLGLGAGAWSTAGQRRWRNAEGVEAYIAAWSAGAPASPGKRRITERLTLAQKKREKLILGLRRSSGVSRRGLEDVVDSSQEKVLLRNGFLAIEGDKIYLARHARFVANDVCARLLRK